MDKLIPSQATHRISDLLSSESSDETKAQTSRWYAEMMIKEFLSNEFSDDDYQNLSLGGLISKLNGRFDQSIIDSLNLIKEFGDKASHYNPKKRISNEDAIKAVDAAIGLYPLIIIDHLKKYPLDLDPDRAILLSTTLPKIRLQVLDSLIDFDDLGNDYQVGLLHKWCLACVKNGEREKARRKLRTLLKRKRISEEIYDFETRTIDEISLRICKDELPIPRTHSDFVRNLNDVKNSIDTTSRSVNSGLINLLDGMAKNTEPSEMGHYKGMQVFIV